MPVFVFVLSSKSISVLTCLSIFICNCFDNIAAYHKEWCMCLSYYMEEMKCFSKNHDHDYVLCVFSCVLACCLVVSFRVLSVCCCLALSCLVSCRLPCLVFCIVLSCVSCLVLSSFVLSCCVILFCLVVCSPVSPFLLLSCDGLCRFVLSYCCLVLYCLFVSYPILP